MTQSEVKLKNYKAKCIKESGKKKCIITKVKTKKKPQTTKVKSKPSTTTQLTNAALIGLISKFSSGHQSNLQAINQALEADKQRYLKTFEKVNIKEVPKNTKVDKGMQTVEYVNSNNKYIMPSKDIKLFKEEVKDIEQSIKQKEQQIKSIFDLYKDLEPYKQPKKDVLDLYEGIESYQDDEKHDITGDLEEEPLKVSSGYVSSIRTGKLKPIETTGKIFEVKPTLIQDQILPLKFVYPTEIDDFTKSDEYKEAIKKIRETEPIQSLADYLKIKDKVSELTIREIGLNKIALEKDLLKTVKERNLRLSEQQKKEREENKEKQKLIRQQEEEDERLKREYIRIQKLNEQNEKKKMLEQQKKQDKIKQFYENIESNNSIINKLEQIDKDITNLADQRNNLNPGKDADKINDIINKQKILFNEADKYKKPQYYIKRNKELQSKIQDEEDDEEKNIISEGEEINTSEDDDEYRRYLDNYGDLDVSSGEGQEGLGRGTYDYEIEDILKKMPNFKGVVAADELDTLEVSPKMSFIVNRDTSDKPGSHWMAVYIDAINNKSVEFFDPLADPTEPIIKEGLKKIVDKINPTHMLKFKENKQKSQSSESDTCAFHSIRFLKDRNRGISFKDATYFKEVPKTQQIAKGEEKAEEIKKQEGFGYI